MSNIIQFPTPTTEQTRQNDVSATNNKNKILDKISDIRNELRECATRDDVNRVSAKLRRWEKKLENI